MPKTSSIHLADFVELCFVTHTQTDTWPQLVLSEHMHCVGKNAKSFVSQSG